jgi:hypothetical protein
MSSGFGTSGIKNILEYGIDLKLESAEEESYYITRMCDFFNEETEFKAYLSGDRSIEVEEDASTPIAEIFIKDSILSMFPYQPEIFEVFTHMLEFISKYHQEITSEFRGSEEHKIESIENVNTTEESEEDDSDDFEWI